MNFWHTICNVQYTTTVWSFKLANNALHSVSEYHNMDTLVHTGQEKPLVFSMN